jgi:ThiF family
MSRRLISRSPDLKHLEDEGYEVTVRDSHLLVGHVPYRNAEGKVAYGTLASTLELAGDVTVKPDDHVAYFIGGVPHGTDGRPLSKILHNLGAQTLAADLVSDCSFSSKPLGVSGYADYHLKMTTYVRMISQPVRALDPTATARTFPVIRDEDDESVFNYLDTASSRAGIGALTEKLKVAKVAIVGLGGTGSYILDFLAKTPVGEIHLFDADDFLQHNAFRSPGAPSIHVLEEHLKKVAYLERRYSNLRSGVVAHAYNIVEENIEELRNFDFVFLTAESSEAKAFIPRKLIEFGVPFVDVGMGLYEEGALGGILRATTITPQRSSHAGARISSGGGSDDAYTQNIQIVELNALNAALAVIKWKKLLGFYRDEEAEYHTLYVIGGNTLINGEAA